MRIAMFTNNYKPFIGGVPISIERLSDGLRELGHEVYIFAPKYGNEVDDPYVIRCNSFKKKLGHESFAIPNILDPIITQKFNELNFDLIHVHHPMLIGWIGKHLSRKMNIPMVFTYHTRYEQYLHNIKLFDKMENAAKDTSGSLGRFCKHTVSNIKNKKVPATVRSFCNSCDMVFAPTPMMKDYLQNIDVESNIKVLPTGLNDSFFSADNAKAQKLCSQYIGDKTHLFCSVARLSKEKNIDFLLSALAHLKNTKGDNFRILLIGEGSARAHIEHSINKLQLQDNVVLTGAIPNDEINSYYKACDSFLFASKSETQGIVLLEAMAAGLPVVAVEASGVVDVVKNGLNGFMTYEDTEKWAEKVALLMEDNDEKEKLKDGAYRTALEYSAAAIAKRAESYYENAIHRRHSALQVQSTCRYDYV